MDANAVVRELVQQQIIPQSVQVEISRECSPKQQNQILHAGLKKSCTEEALMRACDIIIAVKGNPKMRRLGADMRRYLQNPWPGICTSGCVVCVRVYMFAARTSTRVRACRHTCAGVHCICLFVFVCVCMYVCAHVYVCSTHKHTCAGVHACMHACVWCVCVCTCVCVCVCVFLCDCV